ncbi:MAG: hypothetical protein SGI77_23350 [Pirellulaceae bacterium]|nr:hypothetical protein [Pirellulaceae bacterium]
MRLTLRTLLAYLDNVLEPNDANALREKITHGKLSRGIVERIQSVSARPKLAAPKVDARGTAGDANVVAEYLDNTLDAQHIIDFEQACLGEDARLAEVACCHQILTLVLKKPAVVAAPLRDRIRNLANSNSVGEAEPSEKSIDVNSSTVLSRVAMSVQNGKRYRMDAAHRDGTQTNSEHEQDAASDAVRPLATQGLELDDKLIEHVPEYLRSGTSGEWKNAISILGLIAALLFVAWLSVGSMDGVRDLLNRRTDISANRSDDKEMQQANVVANDVAAPEQPVAEAEPIPSIAPSTSSEAPPGSPGIIEASTAPPVPTEASSVDSVAPIAVKSDAPPPLPPENSSTGEISAVVSAPPVPDSSPAPMVPSSPEAPIAADVGDLARAIEWLPEDKLSAQATVFTLRKGDPQNQGIRRLTAGDSTAPDEMLVVPPAYRTEFRMAPGIRWIVADESMMSSSPENGEGSAAVYLQLGRAMVHATPDCQRLTLQNPIRTIVINTSDPTSIVAIELRYKRVTSASISHSIEIQKENPFSFMHPVLSIVSVAGGARVEASNEEPMDLEIGQGVEYTINAKPNRITVKEIPWWYRDSVQRPIDGEAAIDFSNALSADANKVSIVDQIQTMAQGRRGETAALAIRTLMLMGSYSHFIGTDGILSNPIARPHRAVILETFYQSLGANAENLTALQTTIQSNDPPRSLRLLELLSLPDNRQLEEGADRLLVEALNSPFLDERILAIYQLNAIVGKEHGYQSDRPNSESMQFWKRQLSTGKIRWSKSAREP